MVSDHPLPQKAWSGPGLGPSDWAGLWLSLAFSGGLDHRLALCHPPSGGRRHMGKICPSLPG